MTRRKKTLLAVGIVAILAAVGVLAWWLLRGSASSSGGVYVQAVSDVNTASTATANRYSGVIETQKTEEVEFDSSMTLSELLVAEGDRVSKGDPLFTYDTQSTELEIQQAELEVERLNTTVSNDNDQIAQLEKDMKSASSSDKPAYSAQIQQLQAEIAQAQYDIKTKQAEIDKLNASIASATVCAGMDGTVETIADLDSLLSGGYYSSDGSSSAYITILADGDYRVKGSVSEQNIYELSEGQAVIVRSRVDTDLTWSGTITAIDTQGESDDDYNYYNESDTNYAFYVDLDSIDGLMLGQHVTVEMDYGQGEAKEGIWLNSGWIVQEDDGSAYVWAAASAGARLEKRVVELGEYDWELDEYEIVSGLGAGEYLAWPDEDCVVGAATTTEHIIDEDLYDDGDEAWDDWDEDDVEDLYEDEDLYGDLYEEETGAVSSEDAAMG